MAFNLVRAPEEVKESEAVSSSGILHMSLIKGFMFQILKNVYRILKNKSSRALIPLYEWQIDKRAIYNTLKYSFFTNSEKNKILPLLEMEAPRKHADEEFEDLKGTCTEEHRHFSPDFFKILAENLKDVPIKLSRDKILIGIQETFQLSENELLVFAFINYSLTCSFMYEIFNNGSGSGSREQLIALSCLLKAQEVKKCILSLIKKELIYRDRVYYVTSVVKRIYESPFKLRTKEDISNFIIGETATPELTRENFSFLEKELDMCSSIVENALDKKQKGINILLYGKPGTGKTEFSKLVSKYPKYSVLPNVDDGDPSRGMRLGTLKMMQRLLENTKSVLIFDEAEDVFNRGFTEDGKSSKGSTVKLLEDNLLPVIWITNNTYDVDPAFLRRMTYCIEFKELSEETRLGIWKKILKDNKFKVSEEKIKELNQRYSVVPAIISNAVKTAKLIKGTEKDFEQFLDSVACTVEKKKNVKNEDKYNFSKYNIELLNTDTDLKDLTDKILNSGRLDFSMCLYSPPGTGKSLYCNYLGDKLGIEVIHKRVSDLVSCWVGNTEKNIREAFDEAKEKKAMLVFDEADSFFQSRSTAQHSWEVTQVNELLQCMENHKYPFMCTTNIMEGMDEASLRRFSFKVKFNYMKKEQVKIAMKLFFNLDSDFYISGLTPGDFANIQKKADFMKITDEAEIAKMLQKEVDLKKDKNLQRSIGF